MRAKLVSALLVCAVLLGGAVGASMAEQNSQITDRSTNQTGSTAAFAPDTVEVRHGGTATIPVRFDGTDTATVRVGSEAVNYVVLVTVTDGDGDGEADLRFDTDAVAEPNQTLVTTAEESDDATVKTVVEEHFNSGPPHPALDAGNYPLAVFVGNATEENETDTARMRILEATTTTTERKTETKTSETTEKPTQFTTATEIETTTDATDSGPGVPGFGVGAALAALAAAALMAIRR